MLYEGCNFLRQRLVLATLSGTTVRVTKIRERKDNPGLTEFEAGFIRLLDKLTNGSKIEVSETGTSVLYSPGLLVGGQIEHNCSMQRGIGYTLEALFLLAPFAKKVVQVTLRGVTCAGPLDPSVDYYRMCVLPMMKKCLPGCSLEVKLVRRADTGGKGEVYFSCTLVRQIKPILLIQPGKVCRVRGIAHCMCVSPAVASRMVNSARAVLNHLLPDVYIYTDVIKAHHKQMQPGFGLTLVSESTSGVIHAAELNCSNSALLPEDIGQQTAALLLEEISREGCVDSQCQLIPLLYMALGQRDVSKIQLGELSDNSVHFLRHLKHYFQLQFKVECSEKHINLSCVGTGYSNISRRIT